MSINTTTQEVAFQFKGSVLTLITLELHMADIAAIRTLLQEKSIEMPQFFQQTPVSLSVAKIPADELLDFHALVALLREFGLVPIGIQEADPALLTLAKLAGLYPINTKSQADAPKKSPARASENKTSKSSKLITTPIRSGQKIYTQGGDLVVLNTVGAGSEVIADGHIHIYGPLRGRALAGVKGDAEARIFCLSLEAELVSIDGHYKISEDLKASPLWKKPVQIFLADAKLQIKSL